MLTEEIKLILKAELASPVYDAMTAEQAHAHLFEPVVENIDTTQPALPITPMRIAKLLGFAKAESVVAALRSALPNIIDYLFSTTGFDSGGLDPAEEQTIALLQQLKTDKVLDDADLATLTDPVLVRRDSLASIRFTEVFSGSNVKSLRMAAGLTAVPKTDVENLRDLLVSRGQVAQNATEPVVRKRAAEMIIDGSLSMDEFKAANRSDPGFPNTIDVADFQAAWKEVRP